MWISGEKVIKISNGFNFNCLFVVQFTGQEYGNMSICANDKVYPEHKVCRWIDDRNSSACFDVRSLCQDDIPCNVQFKVSLVHSKNKCTGENL